MIKNKGGEGEGFLELSDKDKLWRENFQVKEIWTNLDKFGVFRCIWMHLDTF